MTIEEDRKAEANHHTRWAEDIRKRNERYSEESNWFPFVQNVEDILSRIDKMSERFDDLENKIGETQGMIKNLRKILIKLEVIDDRFIF
jgi:archaellum component FlaC|tara:strand:- start:176 stop:442 length:267 start_codon:yes stop_codon:yes gene_type:complete